MMELGAHAAVSDNDSALAGAVSADKTDTERVSKHKIAEMKAVCTTESLQRIQYQQSIDFLRSQHQELVTNLHEEIERLKRKNRGLVFTAQNSKDLLFVRHPTNRQVIKLCRQPLLFICQQA